MVSLVVDPESSQGLSSTVGAQVRCSSLSETDLGESRLESSGRVEEMWETGYLRRPTRTSVSPLRPLDTETLPSVGTVDPPLKRRRPRGKEEPQQHLVTN